MLGREENIIMYNVMLKALHSRVQENLKKSMTMTGTGSSSLIKLYTWHILHMYKILFFKENPIIADLGACKSYE